MTDIDILKNLFEEIDTIAKEKYGAADVTSLPNEQQVNILWELGLIPDSATSDALVLLWNEQDEWRKRNGF